MPTEPEHTYDLDAYVRRIGLQSAPAPTLEGLRTIQKAHVCTIPFEGFDPFLDRPVSLERADLEAKLVGQARGGYCFEQNGLMLGMLRQIGFQVRDMAARVLMDQPRDTQTPRTHLFLIVTLDGQDWIADFGVGSMSLTDPIRFVLDVEQETSHDVRRIVHEDGRFFHQMWHGDHWFDIYQFTGERMPFIDQITGNWLTSTHPKGMFKMNSIAAIAKPEGTRATFFNGEFAVRRGGETLEKRTMESNEETIELLAHEFGIHLAEGSLVWKPNHSFQSLVMANPSEV
jgi:N-hydroxyarylamine O-acetyltransferase